VEEKIQAMPEKAEILIGPVRPAIPPEAIEEITLLLRNKV
jgi:hypothetical protein